MNTFAKSSIGSFPLFSLEERELIMHLSVVVPSKNGLHHLKDCLPTVVVAAKKAPFMVNIIVVDDNSTDQTLEIAPSLFPSVSFLRNPDQGVCSARNLGVQHAACDWICFLDNDVFVEEDFFRTIQKYLRSDVFCVTCAGYAAYPKIPGTQEQLDGIKLIEWKRGFPRFTKNIYNNELPSMREYPSWGVQGVYFFCNRNRFDELNGFDTLFEPYLLEETDLAYRGLKRGWKIIYAPDTKPRHKCGGTINSKKSKRTQYLSKRNRILFVWKNIQSPVLLFSHIFWLLIGFNLKAVGECIRFLSIIRNKRLTEESVHTVSDAVLLAQSKQFIVKRSNL